MFKPPILRFTIFGSVFFVLTFLAGCASDTNKQPSVEQSKSTGLAADKTATSTDRTATETVVLTNVETLFSSDQHFIRPKFSPNGKQILLTTEGNKGLYLFSTENNNSKTVELSNANNIGYGAAWSANGTQVFFNQKDDRFQNHVKSISIKNGKMTEHAKIHFTQIQSYASTDGKGPILTLDNNTLNVFAGLSFQEKERLVTTEEGRYYQHILSPNGKKMLVHSGQDLMVYKTDGTGRYAMMGKAIGTSWSPNGKYIVGYLDESTDGHATSGSELYLYKADGSKTWKLTNTPNIMEMWPSWSSDGKTIVYADAETGKIFTATIEMNGVE